jgi:FAD/FMN-containing dehydrogenase
MSGHSVPELDIEQTVYGVVSKRQGSISAEHGIGSAKREFLHLSRSSEEVALMRAIKKAMDPHGILNPGKIF